MPAFLRFAAALAVLALIAPPAQAAGTKLTGTVSWTTTLTQKHDTGDTAIDSTEKRTVTLKVKLKKRVGGFGWEPEDAGTTASGRYTLSSTRVQRDADGAVQCTITNDGTGTSTSTKPELLAPSILPTTPSLGGKTKALVLVPVLRWKGELKHVETPGPSPSPCTGGGDTGEDGGSLAVNDDARKICYPAGTSRKVTIRPMAGQVIGAWKPRKRAFSFACTGTWKDPEGWQVKTQITGTVKLR